MTSSRRAAPLPPLSDLLFEPLPSTRNPVGTPRSPVASADAEAIPFPAVSPPSGTVRTQPVQQARIRSVSPEAKRHRGHKPMRLVPLQRHGFNYPMWRLKIGAALRYAGLPEDADNLDRERDQLAIDLLSDSVEDDLVQFIIPVGCRVTAFEVLAVFHDMFGRANEATHASLTAQLWTLCQKPGETIHTYSTRACALHHLLLSSAGTFAEKDFLQCFERGVTADFRLTVRFFRQGPEARLRYPCLLGDLLAEEASMELEAGRLNRNFAGAVTEPGKKPWRASKPAAAPPPPNPALLCWNCGKLGHGSNKCPLPRVRPWPYAPADFVHKERVGAAPPPAP